MYSFNNNTDIRINHLSTINVCGSVDVEIFYRTKKLTHLNALQWSDTNGQGFDLNMRCLKKDGRAPFCIKILFFWWCIVQV